VLAKLHAGGRYLALAGWRYERSGMRWPLAFFASGAYLGARQKESRSFERLCLCAGAGVSPSSSASGGAAARRRSPLLANRHTLALAST
jgi:hypothetical protein